MTTLATSDLWGYIRNAEGRLNAMAQEQGLDLVHNLCPRETCEGCPMHSPELFDKPDASGRFCLGVFTERGGMPFEDIGRALRNQQGWSCVSREGARQAASAGIRKIQKKMAYGLNPDAVALAAIAFEELEIKDGEKILSEIREYLTLTRHEKERGRAFNAFRGTRRGYSTEWRL